jgi:hypothetical protein
MRRERGEIHVPASDELATRLIELFQMIDYKESTAFNIHIGAHQ